ncbi:MAG: hypothetical protein QM737_02900 [Ferruginibacter sp.]
MITPEQVAAVKGITAIKNQILKSDNWDEIVELGYKALNIAAPVPANNDVCPDTRYKDRSKIRQIDFMQKELQWVKERSYPDLETVHFQISASLLMLSMAFVRGGISDIHEVAQLN